MFREMRRKAQQLGHEECVAILQRGTAGVLAVAGDEGYPYAVPISYVYHNGKLYFHCATAGHKLDAMERCDKVSFCVIDQDEVKPAEYTTYFRSVIAFGRARVLQDEGKKRAAIEMLAERYAPGDVAGREKEMAGGYARMCVVELDIEHMTGKAAKELINN